MTLLHEAVETKKLDTRVIERNVDRGVITVSDVQKALQELPDDAENAEWVSISSLLDEQPAGSSAPQQ